MIQKTESPLYVFSHPRSGTHFLGCALALNFELDVQARPIDRGYFERDPPRFVAGGEETDDVPWGSLVAHDQVHRFFDHVTDEYRPRLYIYRRCAEVMASVYRWKMLRNHRDEALLGDEALTFEEFLRRPLGWQESVHTRARLDWTPVEHWVFHVSSWLQSGELCIRYEDLAERYDQTLTRIGEHFGLARRSATFEPVLERVGYNPGAGERRGPDAAAQSFIDDALRRLAPIYPAAAAEQPDSIQDPAVLDRHRRTMLDFGRELCRQDLRIEALERELDAARRAAARAERQAEHQRRVYHRDLCTAENRLERRRAAFLTFLSRVQRLSESRQDETRPD